MDDIVLALDAERKFVFYHAPDVGALYAPPDAFMGRDPSETLPPHVVKPFAEAFEQVSQGETAGFRYWLEMGGHRRWYDARLSPVFEEGEFLGCVATARDVTEIVEAQAALERASAGLEEEVRERTAALSRANVQLMEEIAQRRTSEEELSRRTAHLEVMQGITRAILATRSPEAAFKVALHRLANLVPCCSCGVLIFDVEYTSAVLVATDKASSTILRTGTSIRLDQFPGTKGFVKALQDEKVPVLGDTQNADPCSSLLPALAAKGIRTILSAPLLAQGELLGFLSLGRPEPNSFSAEDIKIAREVAELLAIAAHQAQLFQDLSMNHAQARKLARQVVNAQEEERRRISRILHDETGQTLATLSISLSLIERDLPTDNPLLLQRVARAGIMVSEIADRTRTLAQSLRPPALDHVGLNATLEAYCRQFAAQTQLLVEYRGSEPPTAAGVVKICLYRCLQEALTNVVKHAGASQVRVELGSDPTAARAYLLVQDDGRGFSADRPLSGWTWGGGSGLFGMREWLESLGGELRITSQPGQGCLIEAFLPLKPVEA